VRSRRPCGASEKQREAEARALHKRRQRLLLQAVHGARRAQEIRAFVAELETCASAQALDDAVLAQWKVWTLGQADAMDVRVQPAHALAEWLRQFELGIGDAQ
jgi:hypothetical protein